MNIEKIGNKFKKKGVNVYSTEFYTKIVIYNSLKDTTAPVFATLLLTGYELVVTCFGNKETHGYRQILRNRQDIMEVLNLYYQHVKNKVRLQDIPREIQENVVTHGETLVDYPDGEYSYTLSVAQRGGYVLVGGEYIEYGNIESLRDVKVRTKAS